MSKHLLYLSCNRLSGSIRTERLGDKEYFVVPMRMIVPGVLNGSSGPVLYTQEEISHNYHAWNGVPLVVDHPKVEGQPVSARSPDIINSYAIGFVYNTSVDSGNLDAEAWIDPVAADRVDRRILKTLQANRKLELSTGLFSQLTQTKSNFNGTPYNYVASDIRPDHLAFLPDTKGACSLKDGCGVLVHECACSNPDQCECGDIQNEVPEEVLAWMESNNVTFLDAEGSTSPQRDNPNEENVDMAKKQLVDNLIGNCDCWSEDDRETLMSFDEDKLTSLNSQVTELVDNKRIAGKAKAMLEEGINFGGVQLSYNAANDSWEAPKKDEPKEEPVANEVQHDGTIEGWMKATNAPQELVDIFNRTLESETQEIEEIQSALKANTDFSEEFIDNQDLETLRELRKVIPTQEPKKRSARTLSTYLGGGGGSHTPTQNKGKKTSKPLGVPGMETMWVSNKKKD